MAKTQLQTTQTPEPYEKIGHQWGKERGFTVQVCLSCGLIGMQNPLTDEAIRLGCDHKYHPSWRSLVRKHTRHNGP
jgi:hypothetical protein